MSRFVGFQDAQGVAVLDTVTGELVYVPFHGEDPRVLRPAVVPEVQAVAPAPYPDWGPSAELAGEGGEGGEEPASPASTSAFRPERRLEAPRPLVIRYPDATEVAAIKRARMARAAQAGWTGGDGAGAEAPEPPEPEEES